MKQLAATVNGLSGRDLGITQTTDAGTKSIWHAPSVTVQWGFRVWKRNAAGVETEISAGTPIAVVSRSVDGAGLQYGVWICPATSLVATDNIVIRLYMKFGALDWEEAIFPDYPLPPLPWLTEQLGAISLDAATWQIWYYTARLWDEGENITYGDFWYGTSTYNSRIVGFTWSTGAVVAVKRRLLVGVGL